MSTGVPAMTSMYGVAPATYTTAAAPTMTSMYQTGAQTSMYLPAAAPVVTETIAAPVVMETITAPQIVQAAPSYVAAPRAPSYVAAPVVPVMAPVVEVIEFPVPAPLKLTEGLVPPEKIEAERLAYEKALAAQLKKQSDAAFAEADLKKKMMEQAKITQLAQYKLQVEEQLKLANLAAEQEAMMMVDGLKEAAITQQTAREEAAARAIADFQKKKSLEEYQVKSWQVQKDWFDKEQKLNGEYEAAMSAGQKILGNFNAAQVNVGAPVQMTVGAPQYASYAAAPQYVTAPQTVIQAAPQYVTAPQTVIQG